MTDQINTDYLVAGSGPAGAVLASKLAASGKRIVLLEQGPRFTEADRANMLMQSRESLNDFADYNDDTDPALITPNSSAGGGDQAVEWTALRLFGVGGTALHFEGIMARPRADDLQVRTLYERGRDWPISYAELEPGSFEPSRKSGSRATRTILTPQIDPGSFPCPPMSFHISTERFLGQV